jgi:hypothetical protein
VLIASADGPVTEGARLADSIEEILVDGVEPVGDLACPSGAPDEHQICRGRAASGMVTVLASPAGEMMHVEAFGMR